MEKKGIAWSLWIPVTIAFLIIMTAWATIIKIAADNPTEVIPIKSYK